MMNRRFASRLENARRRMAKRSSLTSRTRGNGTHARAVRYRYRSADGIMTHVAPIRLGISSCLLGHEVRFDGGHKRDRFLTDTFGQFVEWVPVCPEVEAGFGTPRGAHGPGGGGG